MGTTSIRAPTQFLLSPRIFRPSSLQRNHAAGTPLGSRTRWGKSRDRILFMGTRAASPSIPILSRRIGQSIRLQSETSTSLRVPLQLRHTIFIHQVAPVTASRTILFPVPLLPSFRVGGRIILSYRGVLCMFPITLRKSSLPSFSNLEGVLGPRESSTTLFTIFLRFSFLLFCRRSLSRRGGVFLLPSLRFPSSVFRPLAFRVLARLPIRGSHLFLSREARLLLPRASFFCPGSGHEAGTESLPIFRTVSARFLVLVRFCACGGSSRRMVSLCGGILRLWGTILRLPVPQFFRSTLRRPSLQSRRRLQSRI